MKLHWLRTAVLLTAMFPSALFAQKSYSNDEAIIEFAIILFFGLIAGVIFMREFIRDRMIPAIHNYLYPPPILPDELSEQNEMQHESQSVENVGADEKTSEEGETGELSPR
jgi:hypothetical protein